MKNYINRVLKYIKNHLFRDPVYFFNFATNYFNSGYVPKISYYGVDMVPKFLDERKSIIRFGDGEIFILNGGSLPGQIFNEKLKQLMLASISNYSEVAPYVLSLNRAPLEKNNSTLRQEGLIPCWLPSKVYFNLYFKKEVKYLDAAMFYFGDTFPKYFESYLVTKKLILVTNNENITRFKSNDRIPFKNVSFVETPSKDAFLQYDQIKKEIMEIVDTVDKKSVVILAAFGPSSKALAYEFSKEGIQVIDVGQGIEVAYSDKKLYSSLSTLK